MEVYNGRTLLGSIEKIIFTCAPKFIVRDEIGVEKLRISGPLLLCGCGEYEFSVNIHLIIIFILKDESIYFLFTIHMLLIVT